MLKTPMNTDFDVSDIHTDVISTNAPQRSDMLKKKNLQEAYIKHQVLFSPTHALFHTTMYQSFKLY